MMELRPLALSIALAAGPAAAQTSGCIRDSSGALQCAMRPVTPAERGTVPVRKLPRRDLSADAIARTRAQAQSMADAIDRHRQDADDRALQRRQLACPGSPPARGSHPPGALPCGS
jgi:hypothetical protein